MTASLSSHIQQVLVVDISEVDTKLVAANEGTKLFGLQQEHGWHGIVNCNVS